MHLNEKNPNFFQPPQALIDCIPDVSLLHVLGLGNLAHGPAQDEAGVDAPGLAGVCSEETGPARPGRRANPGKVHLRCALENEILHIEVADSGKGIEDVERAMEPLYTTKPELERSGMGFAFMEAFMDDLEVESAPGKGTKVRMIKKIGVGGWIGHQC